mmetsp:Transcript_82307/g.212096  ORF Transcript_82307/g.212096 Transcript_82307/m.212096 type:complete len:219 (-) Transcript_82307:381-1037(-)
MPSWSAFALRARCVGSKPMRMLATWLFTERRFKDTGVTLRRVCLEGMFRDAARRLPLCSGFSCHAASCCGTSAGCLSERCRSACGCIVLRCIFDSDCDRRAGCRCACCGCDSTKEFAQDCGGFSAPDADRFVSCDFMGDLAAVSGCTSCFGRAAVVGDDRGLRSIAKARRHCCMRGRGARVAGERCSLPSPFAKFDPAALGLRDCRGRRGSRGCCCCC